jgi:hypothetical protein
MFDEVLGALGVPMLADKNGDEAPDPARLSRAPGLLPAPRTWDAYAP